jgi:thymidylate synthase (FAD)
MFVTTLSSTQNPQQLVWKALHQDYSVSPVYLSKPPSEAESGKVAIEKLLSGGRGHFGCLEHPSITFNAVGYSHSVVAQARTHRVGITFDVQSFRYTSAGILSVENREDCLERFYFRVAGEYKDRQGSSYTYTKDQLNADIDNTLRSVELYKKRIDEGMSEEHARECLTTNYRQHFVVTFNCRSLMHFLDLRGNLDAQLEIRALAEDLLAEALLWMPEIFGWYKEKRFGRAKFAP